MKRYIVFLSYLFIFPSCQHDHKDFILESYDAGPANHFIYPLVEVNDLASSDFSKNFSYKIRFGNRINGYS